MTINQLKAKKQNEKDAYIMMKDLISKPKKLKSSDFKPGKMVLYSYSPKFDKNPYDMSPLIIVLGRSRKYTLGLNWNWCPPKAREKIMDFIMKKNKKNISKGNELELDYEMVKSIIKGLGPIVRLYLNNRISPKGVPVPSYQYYKAIHLRAENFIGISAKKAWAIAKKKKKKRGGKKR
jgi:hypothetical protein